MDPNKKYWGIMEITASKALFIKLGEKGNWEKECIKNNCLKLGYSYIPHEECMKSNWSAIATSISKDSKVKKHTASFHVNQVKYFYLEGEETLWFTFFNQCLWWCRSECKITYNKDGTKTRPVIDKWNNKDINGNLLLLDNLSGTLLKTQGFRGTICGTPLRDYILDKVNARESQEILQVKNHLEGLKSAIEILVKKLQPEDFELLIDLVFRQTGWQRLGVVGKTQKDIDIDLISPMTGERAFVQVKSQSNSKEFLNYLDCFNQMGGYTHFFYAVHTPAKDLVALASENPRLLTSGKIASMVIKTGLIDWLLKKAS